MNSFNSLILEAKKKKWFYAYFFISPVLIAFGLFRVYPAVETLIFSFFKVEIIAHHFKWVGLKNFALLLQDGSFLKAISNTFIYAVYIVIISAFLGLVLAAMFSSNMKFGSVFKAVYFVPFITSTVAAAVLWGYLYDPKFGLFNMLLKLMGFPPRGWIASSKDALMCIIIFSIWKTLGYNMIIFIAGLQNIPEVYYEAAVIDGAGPLTKFFRITVPLISPTIFFIIIYNTILSLKVFDQVFVLTAGGPAEASTVVVLQIYNKAFLNYRFGYASSMAFVLFVMVMIITIVQYIISKRLEY
ncbi:MAG: sugar ABC transporter permease [Spirochaetales bacterium]|nr:sugar ABC transporter permease [Spirochaetales bacterium]